MSTPRVRLESDSDRLDATVTSGGGGPYSAGPG